jgi:hypothetical protein
MRADIASELVGTWRLVSCSGVTASLDQCPRSAHHAGGFLERGQPVADRAPPDVLILDLTDGCQGHISSLLLPNATFPMARFHAVANTGSPVHPAAEATGNRLETEYKQNKEAPG